MKLIIGIAGASGSGKTKLAQDARKYFLSKNYTAEIISSDNYYKDLRHLSLEERAATNFDHPDSIDFSLLGYHLAEINKRKPISIPQYDFATHQRKFTESLLLPAEIIIVEGILVLHALELENSFDQKIYVDTDENICLDRRINRDINERGRTRESVIEQYHKTVLPMFKRFVEPSKQKAHYIVKNSKDEPFDLEALFGNIGFNKIPSVAQQSVFARAQQKTGTSVLVNMDNKR